MRGRVLADRFVLGEPIGRGGMGAVHRASDRETGREVAVKILLPWVKDERAITRFAREGALLAEIDHPTIVSFVADGVEADGTRYLAMEWIDGVDLETHLVEAAPLSILDGLTMAEKLARALGVLHAAGAVHRDVKPGNILLRDGDARQPVLVDLGIAQIDGPGFGRMTRAGSVVGTLGYMAPEQARGARSDARTDVFALGCVLYECLSAQPAFVGESPRALALKIIVADVKPLSRLLSVPRSLERLVASMLAKEPEDRPADGTALADQIAGLMEELGSDTSAEPRLSDRPSMRITTNERQLVTTVLVPGVAESFSDTGTIDLEPQTDPRVVPMLEQATELGGRTAQLRDGTLLVFFEGIGDAREQVASALRIATSAGDVLPERGVAIATGVAEIAGYMPMGAAIDRAALLMKRAAAGDILVDEITGRLLGRDYVLEPATGYSRLIAHRPFDPMAPFRLLGRPTEVIGRERPLREVEKLVHAAFDSSEPRAVLVLGASGMGKSRFLYEAERRVSRLGRTPTVLRARANPASREPWALVAGALRSLVEAEGDDPLRALRALIGEVPGEQFVAELLRLPIAEEPSVELQNARTQPHVMVDQLRRGLLEILCAAAARGPLLLVFDDLELADDESLALLGRALETPAVGPLAILAASRSTLPDAHHWSRLSEIRLGPLSHDACVEVVRSALGDDVEDTRAVLIADRSEGNPFWLEELIRMEATGATDALPETVVASVHARLERLPPEARRLLRAASVFGPSFPVAPARALAGLSKGDAREALEALSRADLIFSVTGDSFGLRHDVVRRAAYEMLTESDRRAAHGAAAAWLEGEDGHDPRLVADHYELAGLPERAVEHHAHAAEIALTFCDFTGAMERAERGLSAATDDETRARLHHARAESAYWAGRPDEALEEAREVTKLTPRASARWLDATRISCAVAVRKGQMGRVLEIARDLVDTEPLPGHERDLAVNQARLASYTFLAGDRALARELIERAEHHWAGDRDDPILTATIHDARARRAEHDRDYLTERRERQAAGALFREIGDRRRECIARANLGVAEMHLGLLEASRASLEEARWLAVDLGVGAAAAAAECNLGHVLGLAGEHDLGRTMLASSASRARSTGNVRFEGACAAHLARLELTIDRPRRALKAAEEAVRLLETAPTLHGYALATLAEAHLVCEQVESARPFAERAAQHARAGTLEEGDVYALVVYARVLAALHETESAAAVLREALSAIETRARNFDDEETRRAFLERVPEHAQATVLAGQLAALSASSGSGPR